MGYNTNGLSFSALRQANTLRLSMFKNAAGEFAHSELDGSDWSPSQWLEATVGELGEYSNWRKKFNRGCINEYEFLVDAKKELADVVIYLDILAFRLGIDLGDAVLSKWNETSKAQDIPLLLAVDDWHFSRKPTVEEYQRHSAAIDALKKHEKDCRERFAELQEQHKPPLASKIAETAELLPAQEKEESTPSEPENDEPVNRYETSDGAFGYLTIFMCAGLIVLLLWSVAAMFSHQQLRSQIRDFQSQAVENGFATFTTDSYGRSTWRWKQPAETPNNQP